MTIAELNAMSGEQFVAAAGWVFEDSPWVAQRAAAARPVATLDDLHAAMVAVVAGAGRDEQLALLRAHPDLGTRARMTDASRGEQAGAGLDALPPEAFDRLHRLNAAYRERFGFPFLFAVRGSTAAQILSALESRLARTWDDEFTEALRQVSRIARLRLEGMID